jgi:hypothetical protein
VPRVISFERTPDEQEARGVLAEGLEFGGRGGRGCWVPFCHAFVASARRSWFQPRSRPPQGWREGKHEEQTIADRARGVLRKASEHKLQAGRARSRSAASCGFSSLEAALESQKRATEKVGDVI